MKVSNPHFINILNFHPLKEKDGKLYFIDNFSSYESELSTDVNRLKTYLKNWPGFYYFLLYFASTIFFGGMSVKGALKKIFNAENLDNKIIINLGSGSRKYHKEIINVDVYPFSNVDLVANALDLPMKDNSVDLVIAESLLEHLPDPKLAISEIRRVLKKGAYVYGLVPFLYPFHSSPNDFGRWTKSGVEKLMEDFEITEIGMRSGPISALLSILMHIMATIFSFGFERLYVIFLNIFMVLLAPFKILDAIFFIFPQSIEAAGFIYFLAQKK